jgi:hypothetical protein
MKSNPSTSADDIVLLEQERTAYGLPQGVTVSTDIQGVTGQAEADSGVIINYPFNSYDGQVRFYQPETGSRQFDYSREGVAHYGLLAEWVENLSQVDAQRGDEVMQSFMSSAESYLKMWESAERHSQQIGQ